MNRFIEKTMKRSVLVLTCTALILVWGIMSAFQMQRDYLPPINNPTIMVTIQAENLQSDQVKEYLAAKVEEAVRSVDKLDSMETNSYDGGLLASLYFPEHTNMEKAESDVKSAVEKIKLPEGAKAPMVTRVSTNSFPVLRLSLISKSNNIDENRLRTTVQEKVTSEVQRIPGVRDVRVTGAGKSGYVLTLKNGALLKYGLTAKDIQTAISSFQPVLLQGTVQEKGDRGQTSLPIRVSNAGISNYDLQHLKIPVSGGKAIELQEAANIESSIVDLQTISRTDGEPSVLLDVLKTPSSNITDVTNRIKERVNAIPEIKSKEIQSSILFDEGKDINIALQGLIKEGLFGIVFSIFFVFLFFKNIRSTFIIAMSLPICLFTATSILKAIGVSLNLLTISGLIVAMGRVVDDSIVVIDNMYRKRREKTDGKGNNTKLVLGVTEMVPAIVSSTATTIAVFLPISIIGGMIGSAFSGFAWAVVISLFASLAVSIIVVPVLAHLLWKEHSMENPFNLDGYARNILQLVFEKKKVVLILVVILLGISITRALMMPVNFFPNANAKNVAIQIELPEKAQLSDIDAEVRNAETILKSNRDVETFSSTLGSSFSPMFDDVFDEGGGWVQKQNVANISVNLKKGTDSDLFVKNMRHQLTALSTSAVYTISNQNISGDDSRLKLILNGDNQKKLETAAVSVRSKLQMISGLSIDGAANDTDTPRKYYLSLNQEKMKSLGINAEDVTNRIHRFYTDDIRMDLPSGGVPIPIVLRMEQNKSLVTADDPNPEKTILSLIGHEMFTAKNGSKVSLAELATLTTNTQTVISEREGQPFTTVTGNIVSKDISGVTKQVKATLKDLNLPAGVEYSIGGVSKQVKQMVMEMSLAFALSVILVLIIVSSVFRSWFAPLAVLVCIPLALIGSVWSLTVFGMEWNLSALIGVLMLVGIVVTNGIVLVDKIERNRREGMELKKAILQGTSTRVRPVLMTAGTTILTLLPLSVLSNNNSIISQTLGVTVIGGMISSTLICLLVIPIVYDLFSKKQEKKYNPSLQAAEG